MWKGIPKGGTYNTYGDSAGRIEIGDIGKHGALPVILFFGNTGRAPLIGGRFVYVVKIKPISAG